MRPERPVRPVRRSWEKSQVLAKISMLDESGMYQACQIFKDRIGQFANKNRPQNTTIQMSKNYPF